jgi:hypothetical protein
MRARVCRSSPGPGRLALGWTIARSRTIGFGAVGRGLKFLKFPHLNAGLILKAQPAVSECKLVVILGNFRTKEHCLLKSLARPIEVSRLEREGAEFGLREGMLGIGFDD